MEGEQDSREDRSTDGDTKGGGGVGWREGGGNGRRKEAVHLSAYRVQ